MQIALPLTFTAFAALTSALPQLASIDVGSTTCYPTAPVAPVPPPANLSPSACAAAFSLAQTQLLNVTTPFTTNQNGTFLSFPDPTKSCALQIGLLCPLSILPQDLTYKPQVPDLIGLAQSILTKCPKGGQQSLETGDLTLLSQNLGWYVEVTSDIEETVVSVTEALFGKINQVSQCNHLCFPGSSYPDRVFHLFCRNLVADQLIGCVRPHKRHSSDQDTFTTCVS